MYDADIQMSMDEQFLTNRYHQMTNHANVALKELCIFCENRNFSSEILEQFYILCYDGQKSNNCKADIALLEKEHK